MENAFVQVPPPFLDSQSGAVAPQGPEKAVITTSFGYIWLGGIDRDAGFAIVKCICGP